MSESTDTELLRAYADEKSEAAFAELVRRHVNLVYSIALRRCGGDAHLAEDVAQRVFTDLARKAGPLSRHAVLGGWLYRSAHYAASDVVRAERRRRVREQEAHVMQEISRPDSPGGDADWLKLAPVLDQAIGELAAPDRDAVVLRFFEGRPFAEIGATLRLTEDAARMRVERALDKLRAALTRRGITSTTAALGVALANQAAATAPAGIAASVTGAALTGAATGALGVGWMAFMAKTTSTFIVVGLVSVVTGLAIYQSRANAALKREVDSLRSFKERAIAQDRGVLEAPGTTSAAQQSSRIEPESNLAPAATSRVVADSRPEPVASVSESEALAVAKEKFGRAGNVWRTGLQDLLGFNDAASDAMRAWLKEDPAAVVRWLGTIEAEDKQREHTTEALILLEIDSDPGLALLLASCIAKDAPRMNRAHEIISRWAVRDLEGAKQAIAAGNFTDAERKRLLGVAETFARAKGRR